MKLLKQAEYMTATGFTFHPTIGFRSGLGAYMPQAGQSTSFHPQGFCRGLPEKPLRSRYTMLALICSICDVRAGAGGVGASCGANRVDQSHAFDRFAHVGVAADGQAR